MQLIQNISSKIRRLAKQILGYDIWTWQEIDCERVHLGTTYGGYCLYPRNLSEQSIVYSAGVGEDISFDLEMIRRFGVVVNAFDPTPRAADWVKAQSLPDEFRFKQWGLADFDGAASFSPPANVAHVSYQIITDKDAQEGAILCPVYRLQTIMASLGHSHVDVLKMDVEGAEFAVLRDLADSSIDISQILLEFHPGSRGERCAEMLHAIMGIWQRGYRIFHISPSGREYSFIQESHVSISTTAKVRESRI